jgi:hypothetical protein
MLSHFNGLARARIEVVSVLHIVQQFDALARNSACAPGSIGPSGFSVVKPPCSLPL